MALFLPQSRHEAAVANVRRLSQNPFIKRVSQVLFGAPDEKNRSWFRDLEIMELARLERTGFQARHYKHLGFWRTALLSFRLGEFPDGSKFMVHGFYPTDVAVRKATQEEIIAGDNYREEAEVLSRRQKVWLAMRDAGKNVAKRTKALRKAKQAAVVVSNDDGEAVVESDGKKFALGERLVLDNTRRTFLTNRWGRKHTVTDNDLLVTMTACTQVVSDAIDEKSVLYLADRRHGIWRSRPVAYRCIIDESELDKPHDQQMVRDVMVIPNFVDNGKLTNPFGGVSFRERLSAVPFRGYSLFEDEELRELYGGSLPEGYSAEQKEIDRKRITIRPRTREETDALIYQHFVKAILVYQKTYSPISAEDKKLHTAYVNTKSAFQFVSGLFAQAKNRFKEIDLEKGAAATNLANTGLKMTMQLLGPAAWLFVFLVPAIITYGLSLLKHTPKTNVLNNPKEPSVKECSIADTLIPPFHIVERRVRPEALWAGTMKMEATFSEFSFDGLFIKDDLDVSKIDILRTIASPRSGSKVEFHSPKGTKTCPRPAKRVTARQARRLDGIEGVYFFGKGRLWILYLGGAHIPNIAPRFMAALTDTLKPGTVLELVASTKDRPSHINEMSIEEAERRFQEMFGYPMLQPDARRILERTLREQPPAATPALLGPAIVSSLTEAPEIAARTVARQPPLPPVAVGLHFGPDRPGALYSGISRAPPCIL